MVTHIVTFIRTRRRWHLVAPAIALLLVAVLTPER